MDSKARKVRWAGDVGVALYRIARRLDRLGRKRSQRKSTATLVRTERILIEQARQEANKLGRGIVVVRYPGPHAWPMVIVSPGDVSDGSGPDVVFEKGIAVPPRP